MAGLSFRLTGDTRDSDTKLREISEKLKALTDHAHDVYITTDDEKAKVALRDLTMQLDKLDTKVARPHISTESIDKADLALDKLALKMDVVGRKSDETHGKLSSLFSMAKGLTGAGGWSQLIGGESGEGAQGLGDFAASPVGAGVMGYLASLLPGLIGFGTGAGIGALGTLGAVSKNTGLKSLGSGILSSLIGTTSVLAGHPQQSFKAPTETTSHVTKQATGLFAIFDQLQKLVGILTPDLQTMFRASLPFVQQFATALGPIAKALMPAFTQTMKEMVSSGALKEMTQGIVILVQGLGRFMIALGPGLKPSADVFRGTMIVLAAVMDGIGHGISYLSQLFGIAFKTIGMAWKVTMDLLTGNMKGVENAFDDWRHYCAAVLVSMGSDLGSWQHGVSRIFDDLRHGVAATWDALWHDVSSALRTGVDQDLHYLKVQLVDGTINDVKWLGGQLKTLGKAAFNDLWDGIKSVGENLLGWAKSLLGNFVSGIKHFFGIASPSSVFHDIGANLMRGLANGVKAGISSVSRSFGAVTGEVSRWTSVVQKALKMEGLPLSLTAQVLHQISTESGGNAMAINLTDSNAAAGDPSRGLLQTIGTTFNAYHWPGTSMNIYDPLANVAAAINYARHRYGPSLMEGGMGLGSGHGYAAGGWITEPILGEGLRSGMSYTFGENGPEYVTPGSHMRGNGGGNIYITVQGDTDPDGAALRIVQKLRVYKKHHGNQELGLT